MRAYGVDHVGPICRCGCCWVQTTQPGTNRKRGHGAKPYRKRARRAGRAEVAAALRV